MTSAGPNQRRRELILAEFNFKVTAFEHFRGHNRGGYQFKKHRQTDEDPPFTARQFSFSLLFRSINFF